MTIFGFFIKTERKNKYRYNMCDENGGVLDGKTMYRIY